MNHAMGIGVALAISVACNVRADDAKKFDAAKLVGKWKYESGVKAGEKSPADRLAGEVEITKDTFTLNSPDAKFVIAYKIDDKGTPVKIDLDIKEGPVKDVKAEGIITLDGDVLKVCYVPMGSGDRPTKFESTAENKAHYFVLKRVR
jgi:uncharacterized protein (TIGR03067 family)